MADFCDYPPRLATDVEIAEQQDGERRAWIAGSASVGRFILLRETERNVLRLLDGSLQPAALCEQFKRQFDVGLSVQTVGRFLAKLDEIGLLAGERSHGFGPVEQRLGAQVYVRFKLFNPDRLFARMAPALRWVCTPGFVAGSLLLMLAALVLSLLHWAEVSHHAFYVIREHYVRLFVISTLVVFSHEFAHGLTCKVFGGRTPEVGVLLIYYFLPALYCNVSSLHLIQQRSRRLWIILAGVYWQVLVGALGLLVWFLLTPHTLLSELAFLTFLGSVVDVVFNANPLIKLDGYYFLSQWLRLPNLMDRSREYWRCVLRRLLFAEPVGLAGQRRREQFIYAAFGSLSFLYTVALRIVIVILVGRYLMDWLQLVGAILTVGLLLLYVRQLLGQLLFEIGRAGKQTSARCLSRMKGYLPMFTRRKEHVMAGTVADKNPEPQTDSKPNSEDRWGRRSWRRILVPSAAALLIVVIFLLPWTASVGNYGTLVAIPGQEEIIRAPEHATLLTLRIRPGDEVASGAILGQMGNLELEEQLVQVQTELTRVNGEYLRAFGELRWREEAAQRANWQVRQRQYDYDQVNAEQQQVQGRWRGVATVVEAKLIPAVFSSNPAPEDNSTGLPAALAVLESDMKLRQTELVAASTHLQRARQLSAEGLLARRDLDLAETRTATLAMEVTASSERLEAALIDHRRRYSAAVSELGMANADANAERLQIEKLKSDVEAVRVLIGTLEQQRDLVRRKRAQFELTTQRAGWVFGEDLQRMVGRYFEKGTEICRVATTHQLLLRILVPEHEIGDVQVGNAVRLKVRAYPDRVFQGVVSRVGAEGEPDEHQQVTYRVELTIENRDTLLKPGMGAFARIDFGRWMIGRILSHKIKRALRPELWML